MYLLFDFDGTLVDSFHCVLQKTNLLADQFHFNKIKDDEIEKLRDLTSKEVIQFLNVPAYKIPQLIYHMRKQLRAEIPTLKPVPDIKPMLEKLYAAKFTLGILTSNSIENVKVWLETHHLQHLFNFIHTESHYFSKKYLIKKTLRKYQIDKAQAFYIGDETRDIIAAKKNHIRSIGVTWGYNSEKVIVQQQPSFIAKTPDDIIQICHTK